METDQCADTHEDILTVILDEVRSMKEQLDLRLSRLEGTVRTIRYDLVEMDGSIRSLVNAYKNHNQRLTLQENSNQQRLPLRDSGTPTPFAVMAGGKGDSDGE